MTGSWPPAELAGLHLDAGIHTRPWTPEHGYWLRIPTADYRCPCGWTASASGDGVPLITKTIAAHLSNCEEND
ncbi:hypothetical protein [Streptomyces sp. NPDC051173]|uniref:hypothetical protein n=1 Tax=Streptomyces sp. NPDC051173 TaxID=3155164 RepID=UPI003450F6C6